MFTKGQELIDRSMIGDSQVRFERYVGSPLAVVYVYRLGRTAEVPVERLSTEPTFPWGIQPRESVTPA